MENIYVIIKGAKIWGDIFFPSEDMARNYVTMRVPPSHAIVEKEHNRFVSKRYGSQYLIVELKNYQTEQSRIVEEFKTITR